MAVGDLMVDFDPRTILQRLLNEQQGISALVESERTWWQEIRELGKPRFGEMGARLRELRGRLATHFEHEEVAAQSAAGVGACRATPEQLTNLKASHQELLVRLDRMVERTNGSDEAYQNWGEVGAEFGDLIRELESHEKSDLELLSRLLSEIEKQSNPSSLPS